MIMCVSRRIQVYLKCVLLNRRVESFLTSDALNLDIGHQRNLKFYLAMYVAAAQMKHAYVPPDNLITLDIMKLEDTFITHCYERLWKQYQKLAERFVTNGESDYDSLAKGPHLLKAVQTELRRRFTPRKKKKIAAATSSP